MRSNLNLEVLVYVGASFLFLSLFLSLPLYLLISLSTYFFLSLFFISSLFLCVILFTFFSIFLEPEPKLFHVTWVNKLHWHFIFCMVCNGKTKQHRQIRCSGFFGCTGVPGCSGVFRGALNCSGVFQSALVFWCSCVPGFSTNVWQNPVKWLLRARQIRSTSDANMEHAGEENSTWVFRF